MAPAPVVQQDLHFEVILAFQLDGLRWGSGQASRDMLLQLRYMEDIVDLLEPALEVMFVCNLSYALYYPESSYKPSSELPSTCKMESLRRE